MRVPCVSFRRASTPAHRRMHLRLAGYCGWGSESAGVCRRLGVDKVYIVPKDNIARYTPEMPTTKGLLNVRDTARTLGVHENTIRNWEERGILRAVHLPGSGYRRFAAADVERLRAEMFEQLAPATEGPVVNPGAERSGRLEFGDATE